MIRKIIYAPKVSKEAEAMNHNYYVRDDKGKMHGPYYNVRAIDYVKRTDDQKVTTRALLAAFAKVDKDDNYYMLDENGQIQKDKAYQDVVGGVYDRSGEESKLGFILVKNENKYFLINRDGKKCSEEYDKVEEDEDGRFLTVKKGYKEYHLYPDLHMVEAELDQTTGDKKSFVLERFGDEPHYYEDKAEAYKPYQEAFEKKMGKVAKGAGIATIAGFAGAFVSLFNLGADLATFDQIPILNWGFFYGTLSFGVLAASTTLGTCARTSFIHKRMANNDEKRNLKKLSKNRKMTEKTKQKLEKLNKRREELQKKLDELKKSQQQSDGRLDSLVDRVKLEGKIFDKDAEMKKLREELEMLEIEAQVREAEAENYIKQKRGGQSVDDENEEGGEKGSEEEGEFSKQEIIKSIFNVGGGEKPSTQDIEIAKKYLPICKEWFKDNKVLTAYLNEAEKKLKTLEEEGQDSWE